MIKVRTEIEIKAPASQVWQILTDFERYPGWNPFIKTIEGELQKEAKLNVRLGSPEEQGMTFKPQITEVETGKSFRWLGQLLYRKQNETETFERHSRMLKAGIHRYKASWMPDNYIRA